MLNLETYGRNTDEYVTAAGPAAANGKSVILMQPAHDASWDEVSRLIDGENLTVLHSTEEGLVSLGCTANCTPDEINATLARLRSSPLVAFAGKAN